MGTDYVGVLWISSFVDIICRAEAGRFGLSRACWFLECFCQAVGGFVFV